MSTPTDANALLEQGGVPSNKYDTIGTVHQGTIVGTPEVQQQRDFDSGELKFWEDGKPQMMIVVRMQTDERDPADGDDDGIRSEYFRGHKYKALQQAVRRAKARLEAGGWLAVEYYADGETKKRGIPPKLYRVDYRPRAQAAVDTLLDDATPEPDPAPRSIPGPAAREARPPLPKPVPKRPPTIPESQWDALSADEQATVASLLPGF